MPKNGFWSLMIVALVLMMAACTTAPKREYIEPDEPESSSCISECKSVKFRCRDRAREVSEFCTRNYEYKRLEFQRCVAAKGKFCISPDPCPQAKVKHCNVQYDGCFETCGGIILEQDEAKLKD